MGQVKDCGCCFDSPSQNGEWSLKPRMHLEVAFHNAANSRIQVLSFSSKPSSLLFQGYIATYKR